MLIRAGASVGTVDGEPRGGLRVVFASRAPGRSGGGSRAGANVLSPDDFPGRWNRRRAIAPELMPLPGVAADALESAGWWQRGSGEACRGGLVVANDSGPVLASLDFTREIHASPDALVRPAGFLHSLPSTAASVLGLLFGLTDYQACVVSGALSGVQALRHALDLLALGRLDRVLVASLSVLRGEREMKSSGPSGPAADRPIEPARVRLAVALCLESSTTGVVADPARRSGGASQGPTVDCGLTGSPRTARCASSSPTGEMVAELARELPAGALGLAALPLLLVAKYSEKWFSGANPEPLTYHHEEPLTGGQAWIELRKSRDGSN